VFLIAICGDWKGEKLFEVILMSGHYEKMFYCSAFKMIKGYLQDIYISLRYTDSARFSLNIRKVTNNVAFLF